MHSDITDMRLTRHQNLTPFAETYHVNGPAISFSVVRMMLIPHESRVK